MKKALVHNNQCVCVNIVWKNFKTLQPFKFFFGAKLKLIIELSRGKKGVKKEQKRKCVKIKRLFSHALQTGIYKKNSCMPTV